MSQKKALKLGTIAGIDLFIHWTFSLLMAGILAFYLLTGRTPAEALFGLGLILAVFACVVLHEFGHALTARHYDISTQDITLYPIGGIARLQYIPEDPKKELLISLAGPAVNVGISLVLFVGMSLTGPFPSLEAVMAPGGHFFAKLMWINVVLVGFNLIPAFPMDGGRALRAVLASRMDYLRATQIAASIGQAFAMLFGLWGFLTFNPILFFIALFVYLGAQQEATLTMTRLVIQGVPVRQAMITRFETLTPDSTLEDAIQKLLGGSEHDFPIVENTRVVGLLTRNTLMKALAERGRDTPVREVMQTSCATIEDTAMLEEAFRRMQASACPIAPVMKNGHLIGVLTLENVGEWIMISAALKGSKVRSDWGDVFAS